MHHPVETRQGSRPWTDLATPAAGLLLLGVLGWGGSWSWDPHYGGAMFRALVAMGTVGVVWGIASGLPAPSTSRSGPSMALLALPIVLLGALAMVALRAEVGLTTVEGVVIRQPGADLLSFVLTDQGLPMLLHRWLNAVATVAGGRALLLAVHIGLYGLMVVLLLDLAMRLSGRPAGVALTVAYATAPTVLEMFAGWRGYPTYVLLVLIAERAMVASEGERPSDRWVVRALGLAALEIPTALSTLGAYAVGRTAWPRVPWRLWSLTALVIVGVAPVALRARQVHAHLNRAAPEWEGPLLFGLLPALLVLVLLADAYRAGWQRPAVAAAGGALGLVVVLVLTGGLDPELRYGYQSGLLGAVLATAWTARRLGKVRGSTVAAWAVLAVAGLLLWFEPGRVSVPVQPLLAASGLGAALTLVAPRLGTGAVLLGCGGLAGLHLGVLREDVAREAANRHGARVALQAAVQSATPLCLPRGVPRAMVQVAWADAVTRGWSTPLSADTRVPVALVDGSRGDCGERPYLLLTFEAPPDGCTSLGTASAAHTLWRCEAG